MRYDNAKTRRLEAPAATCWESVRARLISPSKPTADHPISHDHKFSLRLEPGLFPAGPHRVNDRVRSSNHPFGPVIARQPLLFLRQARHIARLE